MKKWFKLLNYKLTSEMKYPFLQDYVLVSDLAAFFYVFAKPIN